MMSCRLSLLVDFADKLNSKTNHLLEAVNESESLITKILLMHTRVSLFDDDIESTSSQVEKSQSFRMELAKLIERTYLLGFSLPINDSVTSRTTLSNIALEYEFLRDHLLNNKASDKSMGYNIDDSFMENTVNTDEDSEEIQRNLAPYLRVEPSISHLQLKPLRCPSKKISKKKSRYRLSSIYTLNPLTTDPEIYCDDFDNLDYSTASELDNSLGANDKRDNHSFSPGKNRYHNVNEYLPSTVNPSIGSSKRLQHSPEIDENNNILSCMNNNNLRNNNLRLKSRARCNSLPETPLLESNLSVFSDLTNLGSSVTSNHDIDDSLCRKGLRHFVSCSAELSHMTQFQERLSITGKSKKFTTYNKGEQFRETSNLVARRKESVSSNLNRNQIGFESDILSLSSKKNHYEDTYSNRDNEDEGNLGEKEGSTSSDKFLALDTPPFEYPNKFIPGLQRKFHNPILDVTINFPNSPAQVAEHVYSVPDRRRLFGGYNQDVNSIQLLHNTLENDKMNSRNRRKNFQTFQSFIPPMSRFKKNETSIRRSFCNNENCSSCHDDIPVKVKPKLIRRKHSVKSFPYKDRTNGGSHSLIWIKANQMFVSHGEKTLTRKPLVSEVKHDSLREALSNSFN